MFLVLTGGGDSCDQKPGNAIILMARSRLTPARPCHQDDGVTFARAIKMMALPEPQNPLELEMFCHLSPKGFIPLARVAPCCLATNLQS